MQTRILSETVITPINPSLELVMVAHPDGRIVPSATVRSGEVVEQTQVVIEGNQITAVDVRVEINEEVDEFTL